jgi:hypothetical protein
MIFIFERAYGPCTVRWRFRLDIAFALYHQGQRELEDGLADVLHVQ